MEMLLSGTVVALGLLALLVALLLWRRPATDAWVLRLLYFLVSPVLFQVGYALVLAQVGLARWGEAGGLYWDSWLGFGLTALLSVWFALTRFRGGARVLLTLLALGWILYPLWITFKP